MKKKKLLRLFEVYNIYILFTLLILLSINAQAEESMKIFVPKTEEGSPKAGKRVKVYLPNYPEAYYVLFLPYNFDYKHIGKWPVIVEAPSTCVGPDYQILGYGITLGKDYIWVCVPFIDEEGRIELSSYGNDPLTTVNFWLAILEDLNSKFQIDNDKIILSGFSRGAVSTCYIGNYNEVISSKWAAYFAHAHFDGCCQNTVGDSEERIQRIQNRKVLITVGESDPTKQCSKLACGKLLNFTYLEIPNFGHNDQWILEDSESATQARHWLNNIFTGN